VLSIRMPDPSRRGRVTAPIPVTES